MESSTQGDQRRSVTRADRIALCLCAVSLLCYLLSSDAVRAFGREVARLLGKL